MHEEGYGILFICRDALQPFDILPIFTQGLQSHVEVLARIGNMHSA